MKFFGNLIAAAMLLTSSQTFAAYKKVAECFGRTQKMSGARAVLFVDKDHDTLGFIAIQVEQGSDFLAPTQVSWTSNPQGYPRFFDNDFDLDIVINDRTPSVDDVLVGQDYISQLQCAYKP